MIWFTSDTHFNHKNIIKYCKRPFASVEEMNETLIQNWNNVVSNKDTIYHLGDFCFGVPYPFLGRLNGKIKIISGSHDFIVKDNHLCYGNLLEIEVNILNKNQLIVLCHYSMRSWNKSHYGSWHLYGHHHGGLAPHGLSFDVGVDTNDFYPYSLDEVARKISTLSREFIIKER